MDAVKLVIVFLLFLGVPFAIVGLWWWFWFWVGLSIYLALYELISKLKTGRTISQRFWDWKNKAEIEQWQLWMVGVGLVCFWSYLLLHLYKGW